MYVCMYIILYTYIFAPSKYHLHELELVSHKQININTMDKQIVGIHRIVKYINSFVETIILYIVGSVYEFTCLGIMYSTYLNNNYGSNSRFCLIICFQEYTVHNSLSCLYYILLI